MSVCKMTDHSYLVYGLGTSGRGAVKLLEKLNVDHCVWDDDEEKRKDFPSSRISADADKFDFVIMSPGIKCDTISPDQTIGEIDLGFAYMKDMGIRAKIIGVTGSSGKTTTVTMIEKMLSEGGYSVAVAGNIGRALCDLLSERTDFDVLVLELSSFQLKLGKMIDCDLSVITNIRPNHLDVHKDFNDYLYSKLKIADMTVGKTFTAESKENVIQFCDVEDFIFVDTKADMYDCPDFESEGDRIDFLLAKAVAAEFGMTAKQCVQAIENYQKPRYRFEIKGKIAGKTVINDSKSTCVYSTLCALRSVKGSCCLIAGGKDKNVGYDELFEYLKKRGDVTVFVSGENAQKISANAKKCGFYDLAVFSDLSDAVKGAFSTDRKTILFSPMAASFDRFSSFIERGQAFDELIKKYEAHR